MRRATTWHACFRTARRRSRWATLSAHDRSARRAHSRESFEPTQTERSDRASQSPARWSVSRVLSRPRRSGTVIHLRRRLPDVFSGRPESGATPLLPDSRPTALLFGLAPGRACPFHTSPVGCPTCRLVSVALVLASRRTGVTRYPASRSSDFPRIELRVSPMGYATVRPSRWRTDSTLGMPAARRATRAVALRAERIRRTPTTSRTRRAPPRT